jgi:hypothetical protein
MTVRQRSGSVGNVAVLNQFAKRGPRTGRLSHEISGSPARSRSIDINHKELIANSMLGGRLTNSFRRTAIIDFSSEGFC